MVRLIHDLAVPSGVSDLIDQVGKNPVDLLVNNAGIAIVKPFCEITSIEWEQTVGVNITAPFMLMQHFAPAHAARLQHRQYSFHRSEDWVRELERLLHEQVRARRFLAMRARRIARPQDPGDQRLPAATDTNIWNQIEGKWPRQKMISPEEVASAVAYALSRPADVALENITHFQPDWKSVIH